jgi:hypothetical protein
LELALLTIEDGDQEYAPIPTNLFRGEFRVYS